MARSVRVRYPIGNAIYGIFVVTVGVSAVFDRATAFIDGRRRSVAALALLPFAASFAQQVGAAAFADTAAPGPWLYAAVGLSLVSLWGQLAVAAIVVDPPSGPVAAIRRAAIRLPLAVVLYVLLLAALGVVAAPAVVAVAVAGWRWTMTSDAVGAGTMMFVMTWSGLTSVVALVLSARMLPLAAVIVGERRGLRSLSRAVRLTHGLTAKLTGLLLLFALVAVIATLAVQIVVGSVARLLLGGGAGVVNAADVVTGVAVAGLVAGLTVLVATFDAMLYRTVVAPDGAMAAA